MGKEAIKVSTGANPLHSKPASRVVVSCMGDSIRIAEEYASKRVSRLYYRAPK